MSKNAEIKGNKRIIRYLSQAAARDRLSHAYIFSGEKGMGKKLLSGFIADSLLCSNMGKDENAGQISFLAAQNEPRVRTLEDGPCGRCSACSKTLTGNHPDIIWVEHEKPNVITVGEIRKFILDDVDIKPFYGPYKIYIIPEAHLMNENAQNALLKTIEEPPEYALILMLAENARELLPTIRSRCITLEMERLDELQIKELLSERLGIKGEAADEAAAFASGNAGKALEAADEDSRSLIGRVTKILKDLPQMKADEIYNEAKELEKESRRDVLEIVSMWLRDVLVLKDGSGRRLYFPALSGITGRLSEDMSFESINEAMQAAEQAGAQLLANVKAEAVYEDLFLKLRRKESGQ